MIIQKDQKVPFLMSDTSDTNLLNNSLKKNKFKSQSLKDSFQVVSSYEGDPFIGHLSTPITTSSITKTYLSLLPAYKEGISPLLKGINIGFVHAYFLVGPFVKLGPLRNSSAAEFIGFLSALSLILILTAALVIYGLVTFPKNEGSQGSKNTKVSTSNIDFLSFQGWNRFTSGFIIGGFGGAGLAYVLLKFFPAFH